MKNLKIIVALVCLMTIFSCVKSKNYKYTIQTESNTYRTNSYEKVDSTCIEFKNQCGCGGRSKGSKIRVCGNYSVISNK
jgi:hypothetical protein